MRASPFVLVDAKPPAQAACQPLWSAAIVGQGLARRVRRDLAHLNLERASVRRRMARLALSDELDDRAMDAAAGLSGIAAGDWR
jgi:hypothetical protein